MPQTLRHEGHGAALRARADDSDYTAHGPQSNATLRSRTAGGYITCRRRLHDLTGGSRRRDDGWLRHVSMAA
jgi:hypothetical protein